MKDPYFITAERLEEVLEQNYSPWDLTDLLQQPYPIDTIDMVYTGLQPYDISTHVNDLVVPIDGVTTDTTDKGRQLLRIPDTNLQHIRSMYIGGADTWIIWLQSKLAPDRCWAWEIDVEWTLCRIKPLNPQIRQEGWFIHPNQELTEHITQWSGPLFLDRLPDPAVKPTRLHNTAHHMQRQLPLLDPALLAQQTELAPIQDDLMNKMITGCQTN